MAKQKKTTFKNVREVAEYVIKVGWQVSRSSVYNHAKQGKIRAEKNGTYTLKRVEQYAGRHLVLKKTKQKIGDDLLQRSKVQAEVDKLSEQAKLARIKRMAVEGRYIEKSEMELEMAARAASLEAGLKYTIRSKAADWIELVKGDVKCIADFIRELNAGVDSALNDFATTKEFQVILKITEG